MITQNQIDRFNSKHQPSGECLLWQDSLDKDGYGSFFLLGRNRRAHRVAWFIKNGSIPEERLIGHTCRNRHCVNVQHLRPVTHRENALSNSKSPTAINARKTLCTLGHPLDKHYQASRGKVRYCSICQRDKQKKLRANRIDPLKGIL